MDKVIELFKLLPALFTVIKAVEDMLPEAGQGAAKLELVRQLMETAYGEVSKIWPVVIKAVAVIVSFCNAKGLFKKDPTV